MKKTITLSVDAERLAKVKSGLKIEDETELVREGLHRLIERSETRRDSPFGMGNGPLSGAGTPETIITPTIDCDLLRKAGEATDIADETELVLTGLRALIAHAAYQSLAKMGGTQPQLKPVIRARAEPS